jgi:hypothetical protein
MITACLQQWLAKDMFYTGTDDMAMGGSRHGIYRYHRAMYKTCIDSGVSARDEYNVLI